jgi:hypothetical protein
MNGTYKAVDTGRTPYCRAPDFETGGWSSPPTRRSMWGLSFRSSNVQGDCPGLKLPRMPGHEVVGRVDEVGPNVSKWKIGAACRCRLFGRPRTTNVSRAYAETLRTA